MKKRFLCLLLLVLILIPSVVLADVGPKPSIKINATNMPDSMCYMDLLVEVSDAGEADPEFLESEYDQNMVRLLSSYYIDGWGPAVVNNERIMFDDIICKVLDGECVKHFGYMPPDIFKIIVVSEDGNIVISNIVERKAFDSTIDFDYESGVAEEREVVSSILLQFLITFSLTLLIEGLILIAFRFSFKKYWLLVLLVNLLTQIMLTVAISLVMVAAGIFLAILVYFLAELIIFITEGIIYGFTLKQHKIGRRILYALTANIVSFVMGFIIILAFGL